MVGRVINTIILKTLKKYWIKYKIEKPQQRPNLYQKIEIIVQNSTFLVKFS